MDRGGTALIRFVLDASVAAAWFLPDEEDGYANRVLWSAQNSTIVVPQVWRFEMANSLAQAVKRGRTTDDIVREFLSIVEEMQIEDFEGLDIASLFEAARTYKLTSYDASYLLVASRTGLPLATNDADLRAAARKARVSLYTAKNA